MENEIDDNGVPKTDSEHSKQTNRKKKKLSEKNKTEGKSDDKTNYDDANEYSSPEFSKPKPSASTAADHNFFEENSAADAAKSDEEEASTPWAKNHAAANDTFVARANRTRSPWNSLSHNALLLMVAILCIIGQMGGVSGTLTVPPANVLAKLGTEVRLRCSTDHEDPVYWFRRLHGSSETQTLYYGSLGFSSSVNGRFKMDHSRDQGSHDVIISSVTAADAGVYACQDDGGMGDRKEMELVVFEYFNCEMPMPPVGFMGQNDIDDIAEDEIRATCSLKYHGNQKPRFHWSWSVDSVVHSNESVSGSTMVNLTAVTRPREELNGAKLTCIATVSSDGSSAPEDSAVQWTSPHVTVLHTSLQKGSVEQCQSCPVILVCDPKCVYSEERVNSEICRCVATYEAKGSRKQFTFSTYACDGSVSESNYFVVIIVAVAVAVGVVAAAAVAVVAFKVMKRKREPHSNGSDELMLSPQHREAISIATQETKSKQPDFCVETFKQHNKINCYRDLKATIRIAV